MTTNKQVYDATFKTLGALYAAGKIDESVKQKAIVLGNVYLKAHNAAVDVLLAGQPPILTATKLALDAFLEYTITYTKVE